MIDGRVTRQGLFLSFLPNVADAVVSTARLESRAGKPPREGASSRAEQPPLSSRRTRRISPSGVLCEAGGLVPALFRFILAMQALFPLIGHSQSGSYNVRSPFCTSYGPHCSHANDCHSSNFVRR